METLRDRVRQREREQTIKKQTLPIREQSDSTIGVVGCTGGGGVKSVMVFERCPCHDEHRVIYGIVDLKVT